MTYAIETDALTRVFRKKRKKTDPADAPTDFVALSGVSLQVKTGELFGLLGPNGAGKTTLIKILTTLLAPTSGRASIEGRDVITQAEAIRPRINLVSGGESCGYGVLTVRENLWLFAQMYGVTHAESRKRIDKMLDIVGLMEKADTRISHLSTGQRQKMNFCRGFITDPTILFLDEPTLGLDVNAARAIRQFVREWLKEKPGRTLLLTTHYLTEADELCDRIAIIEKGQVLSCDTPQALKRQVQELPVFVLKIQAGEMVSETLKRLPGVANAVATAGPELTELKLSLREEPVIGQVVKTIVEEGGRILSLQKVEPSLEDAFIHLVGHGMD